MRYHCKKKTVNDADNTRKTAAYVLLHIFNGRSNATVINKKLPEVTVRSIQRALARLHEMGLVSKSGPDNDPAYVAEYPRVLGQTKTAPNLRHR